MTNLNSVLFNDGFKVQTGDIVQFRTSNGHVAIGVVRGIQKPRKGATLIKVEPTNWNPGPWDSYPLRDGGQYIRPLDTGLYGGELIR